MLKPYDDYNVLKKDDIKIFIDYKENKESVPMYSRWVQEMRNEQFEEYEKSIIKLGSAKKNSVKTIKRRKMTL